MDSRIFKIAAGIIIVGIVAIALKIFTGTNAVTSVTFGEVLNQIHSKTYTFNIVIIENEQVIQPTEAKVHKSGKLRWDSEEIFGGLSMISNLKTGERFLLYHAQKLFVNMKDILDLDDIPNDLGPFGMFMNPVENLWNLQDGSEISLGEKEIEGQHSVGFKIHQEDESYPCDIIVWAYKETGFPILVEITIYNPENPSQTSTMKLNNFNLNAELDEELFNMEPPEGYTFGYKKTLEETIVTTESTQEAYKIQQSIELWNSGQEDKAIEAILSVDWKESFVFSDEMYLFNMTNQELIQLKQEDQQKILETLTPLRDFCRKIWELAESAKTQGDYEKTEKYINATLELGRLMNRNPELIYTAQMAGQAIIKKSLTEFEKLYQAAGDEQKLQQTQQDIKEIDTEIESLRNYINNTFNQ